LMTIFISQLKTYYPTFFTLFGNMTKASFASSIGTFRQKNL
jgi:hypothetical protein